MVMVRAQTLPLGNGKVHPRQLSPRCFLLLVQCHQNNLSHIPHLSTPPNPLASVHNQAVPLRLLRVNQLAYYSRRTILTVTNNVYVTRDTNVMTVNITGNNDTIPLKNILQTIDVARMGTDGPQNIKRRIRPHRKGNPLHHVPTTPTDHRQMRKTLQDPLNEPNLVSEMPTAITWDVLNLPPVSIWTPPSSINHQTFGIGKTIATFTSPTFVKDFSLNGPADDANKCQMPQSSRQLK